MELKTQNLEILSYCFNLICDCFYWVHKNTWHEPINYFNVISCHFMQKFINSVTQIHLVFYSLRRVNSKLEGQYHSLFYLFILDALLWYENSQINVVSVETETQKYLFLLVTLWNLRTRVYVVSVSDMK